MGSIRSRLVEHFPKGYPLDDVMWRSRHRTVVVLLWLHIVGLFIYGLIREFSALHLTIELTAIVVLAGLATLTQSRLVQSLTGTLGLISCSALLVHLSGGLIEAHFHFFIMIGVVTLYQSWIPFGLAMVYVVIHHGTVGVLDPESVYNHPAAIHRPWLWAGIHGLFIGGAALAGLGSWKYNEVERERAQAAAVMLHDKKSRQREAIQLNDTVIQGLIAVKYAAELGQPQEVTKSIDRTLALAQQLVSDLMADDETMFEPGGLRRDTPAQAVSDN